MLLPEVNGLDSIADKTLVTAKRKKKHFADFAEQSSLLATRNKKRLSNFASQKLVIREAEGFVRGVIGVGNEKMLVLKEAMHLKKLKLFNWLKYWLENLTSWCLTEFYFMHIKATIIFSLCFWIAITTVLLSKF